MFLRKIVFFLLACFCFVTAAMAQNPSCSAASKFYSKDSINVTTFGASTVEGVGGFNFQDQLKRNLEYCYPGKKVTVTNNGIHGQTTTQGLIRFPQAIAGRTGFILILMGANDAMAMANKKMRLSVTEKNMRYYIEESLRNKLIPIIGTLQFLDDRKDQFSRTTNLYVKQINYLYSKLADEYHIYLADINKALGRDFRLYQDFIHPNEKGYRLISYIWYDAINRAIEDKLLISGLSQNYPNPVRDNTTIGFSLSQAGRVQITLFNMSGSPVKALVDEYQNAGYHETLAALSDLRPGIYIYVMRFGGQQLSKKLIFVK